MYYSHHFMTILYILIYFLSIKKLKNSTKQKGWLSWQRTLYVPAMLPGTRTYMTLHRLDWWCIMKLLKTEHWTDGNYNVEKRTYDTCIITNRRPKISAEERQKILDEAGSILLSAYLNATKPERVWITVSVKTGYYNYTDKH